MHAIRLPLEGTYNTRELGGYPVPLGITSWKKFLRSDSLTQMTESDKEYMKIYPVTTIIDLRSQREVEEEPDPEISGIDYYHLPIGVVEIDDVTKMLNPKSSTFIVDFYIQCLEESTDNIRQIFEHFATETGCVVFHCAAGKDRTGIIAALLLSLAGASKEDIVANYQTTYTYLKANPIYTKERAVYARELLYSSPNYIKRALSYLDENYQGTRNYLMEIGLSEIAIQRILENFIQKKVSIR
jgi:protein-tyrosine phosphatase